MRHKYSVTMYSKAFILLNRLFIFAVQTEYPFVFFTVIKLSEPKLVEHETLGMCPECKEWTSVPDSCCGAGAWIDGGHVSDEDAQYDIDNPRVSIKLLVDAPQEYCHKVHSALFDCGISSNFFSGTNLGTEYRTSSGMVTDLSNTIDLGISPSWPTGQLIYKPTGEHVFGSPKYKGWNVNIFVPAKR